ncbi:MAG: 50S ribosomal protein L3 [Clostridia bacterium]|nr:50S ribosomal protein L3 [Clostridia bacterium]MDH7571929.1 50S ribosomal protein L3 [Clostridia bacterium]
MGKAIIGRKLGMTQVFTEDGRCLPVTVIQAGPCVVVQKRVPETDGYPAIQVGFEPVPEHRVNRPLRGHFARAKAGPFRYLREFRVDNADDYQVGQELRVEMFKPGEAVDVTGVSRGHGFAGGIKRHGFQRGPMSHGSKYHRRPGSLAAKGPARVFKGRRLPGRMGQERVTVQNLEVVRVDPERNLLLVKGSVPGIRRSLVMVRASVKAKAKA